MDLATDQAGLQPPFATAVHSFDPGIAPNTLFWTIPIPSESVDIDFDDAKAFLRLNQIAVFDWTSIPNSLLRGSLSGPPSCATFTSLQVRWSGRKTTADVCDQVNHFRGRFIEDTATVKFTVEEPGFRFVSDPANTSVNEFSEIGRERNGSFFTPCA